MTADTGVTVTGTSDQKTGSKDYAIEVHRTLDAAASVWHELEASGDAYGFQCFDWLQACSETVGVTTGMQPCIAVASTAAGDPLLLLPLAIERRRGCRCLVWMGGELSDYHAPVLAARFSHWVSPAQFPDLWRQILAALPAHDVIVIERQPAKVGSQNNPFRQLGGTPHPSHAHMVHLDGDFDTFLARQRSAKSRSTDRRKRRKLAAHGTLEFVVPEPGSDQEHQLLEAVMRQKSANYQELGVKDLFADPAYRQLLRRLCKTRSARDIVHLSGLLLDGRVIATHFGLLHKQRLYYLLPAYERGAFSSLSPGSAHLHFLLEWCFRHGVGICDFTVGDEPYKFLWRDTQLDLVDLVQPVTARGHLWALPANAARRLKRRIKNSPALLSALLAWRARLASLKGRAARKSGGDESSG